MKEERKKEYTSHERSLFSGRVVVLPKLWSTKPPSCSCHRPAAVPGNRVAAVADNRVAAEVDNQVAVAENQAVVADNQAVVAVETLGQADIRMAVGNLAGLPHRVGAGKHLLCRLQRGARRLMAEDYYVILSSSLCYIDEKVLYSVSQKRKLRFNFKSQKNENKDHKTNNRE